MPLKESFSFSQKHIDERIQLICFGALVGLFSGFAAFFLNRSMEIVSEYLHPIQKSMSGFLLPAFGAVLGVVFLRYIAKEEGGHGVPEVIYSISKRGGFLKLRSCFSRLIACLFTIATGGSAGPEAPIVISGASIGANIATFFKLNDRKRIVLIGCGSAGAIASIFNAPVTGIVFTLEIIMGEWSTVNIIPIAIASVVGTEVSRILTGNQIQFQAQLFDISIRNILVIPGLAILLSIFAVLFIRLLRFTAVKLEKTVPNHCLRAGLGGLAVGIIGIGFPIVLGEGYHSIRTIITNEFSTGIWMIGLLAIIKIIATSLTVGSGGSGGVFAPSLLTGSFLGLFYKKCIVFLFPSALWAGDGYFALLGMAGLVSSVLQAPLTGIFLIVEITGSYQLLVSVMLISVFSATLSHLFEHFSIYHHELIEKGELLRPRTDQRILSELGVEELLKKDCIIVNPEMILLDFISVIKNSQWDIYIVEDSETKKFVGLINLNDIHAYIFDNNLHHTVLVEEIMDEQVTRIAPEDDLVEVMDLFEQDKTWCLPVVKDDKFIGLLTKSILLDHYRRELLLQGE